MPQKALPGTGDFLYGLASGPSWSAEYAIAGRLAALSGLDQEGGPHGETGPRLAPIVESSPRQALADLLTSPTIDLAILPLPLMEAAAAARPGIRDRVGYVAPLYLETVHVIARRGVADVRALAGRRVAVGEPDGTGARLLAALGVEVEPADVRPEDAVEAVRRGDVDAAVLVTGDPVDLLRGVPADAGLALVPVAFGPSLDVGFAPARILASDYPGLAPDGDVPAVAVQAVLAAYLTPAWSERSKARGALLAGMLDHLAAPGALAAERNLRQVNWAASVPGWHRLDAVTTWLARNGTARAAAGATPAAPARP